MRKRVTAGSVVEQTRSWGMTTTALLARGRFGGDTAAAKQMLGTLSRAGLLHRRLCRVPGEAACVAYYTTVDAKPLGVFALRDRYAVARACLDHEPPVSLLSEHELTELLAPVLAMASAPLMKVSCFVEAGGVGSTSTSTSPGPRLCRVVVLRDRDVDDALARLERAVASPEFAPWWWFARSGRLTLVVLMYGREHAAELSRWLARRPLVARLDGVGVIMDTRVRTAARLRA